MLRRRNSRRSRQRIHRFRRLRSEQLEQRVVLNAGGFCEEGIHFDTSLTSLDLSGGPFPIPLASDPTNSLPGLPASVDGYGFVDSTVTVTLSSQRTVSPGPQTLGEACAFLSRQENDLNGIGGPHSIIPINPDELDGEQFFVDSFFDVFFDITVTDVDTRPGRDYAGQPDGASIVLQDNGPGHLQSLYFAEFQKDVPNFGLVPPPPEASRPYVGHFDIVIPLPGDVNGNGVTPDYLKFTLASHLAGAATYIELPDGTVIDQFDSTASILGAVSDDLADPPFSIGSVLDPSSCVPGAPSFPGAPDPCTPTGPGLSGPTVATSLLLTPVVTKDPGFPYVDANNDKLFNPADGDVLLDDGELHDGFFDTDIAEGPDYTVAIPGAGLRIHGTPISLNVDLDYSADGGLTVNTDLTAVNRSIFLESRTDNVDLDDPTLHARKLLEITAAIDIVSEDDVLRASGSESVIRLVAGEDILLTGTKVTAMREVDMDAGVFIIIGPSASNPATITASPNVFGKVDMDALGIDISDTQIDANREIFVDASVLIADRSKLHAGKTIDLHTLDFLSLADAMLDARVSINIESDTDDVILNFATVQAAAVGSSTVLITAGDDVGAFDASISAARSVHIGAGDSIFADDSTLTATANVFGEVSLDAGSSVDVILASIAAAREVDIDAGFDLVGFDSEITAGNQGVIDLDAGRNMFLDGATLKARKTIDLDAVDFIFAAGAKLLAQGATTSKVTATAGVDLILTDAVIRARALIDLTAGGVADLTRSSIGITHLGAGDLKVTASTIIVTDAVLKAPDDLLLLGTVVGIPDFIGKGFLAPVSC